MVGRLVEQQQVRLTDQGSRQGYALGLAARELGDRLGELVQPQSAEDLLGALLVVPGALGLHLGQELLHTTAIPLSDGTLPAQCQLRHGIVGAEAGLEDRPLLCQLGELREVGTA